MAIHRWKFTNPFDTNPTTAEYELPRNPSEATSPIADRVITVDGTVGGGHVAFEGAASTKDMTFKGRILNQAHYRELLRWHQLQNYFEITDHFGRVLKVVPISLSPISQARAGNYWDGTYDMTVRVFSVSAPTVADIWS